MNRRFNPKAYKSLPGFVLILLFSFSTLGQSRIPQFPKPPQVVFQNLRTDLELKNIDLQLKELDLKLKNIDCRKLSAAINKIDAQLAASFKEAELSPEPDFPNKASLPEFFSECAEYDNAQPEMTAENAEKTKTISKSYSVDSKDKLSINNQYGRVNINVWNRREIKVDVEIKAYESSESKAQDLLESVTIAESRQGDLISYKTSFDRNNMNWWTRTRNGKEERRGVQVNYTVYMPSKNPLDISNRYGSTSLPDFSGPVNINSSYGSFTAQKLDNPANRVKVSYGSANIESYSSGNLNMSYGSLKLDNADRLNADISYGSAKIGKLTGGGNLDVTYTGGFKIDDVDKSVKNLVINCSYSGVTLGIDESANFDFDVTVSYAGFNYDDSKVNIISKTPEESGKGWNPTKNYKGKYGKGSDSRILIKSNYGAVRFL